MHAPQWRRSAHSATGGNAQTRRLAHPRVGGAKRTEGLDPRRRRAAAFGFSVCGLGVWSLDANGVLSLKGLSGRPHVSGDPAFDVGVTLKGHRWT